MQDVWNNILKLLGQIVSPDWGSLVALIPLGVAAIVVMWLVWLGLRLARAPGARRGMRRVPARPPAGTHMPGPSLAPLLAALGAVLLLLGAVAQGPMLPIGIVALVLALLYWGREAMRDYDHLVQPASSVPAVLATAPPPGVHMPGPSFRPVLVSIAAAVLFYGLVFKGALLVVGILMLAIALLGWLADARAEYRAVEVADLTGHLESQAAPRYPTGTIAAFAVLFIVGVALNSGIVPPQQAAGGGSGGGAASPGASASAGTGGGGGSSPVPSGDITIRAQNIAFDIGSATASAGKAFTIAFINDDSGTPHNVAIKDASGTDVFKGEIITGPAAKVYDVPALKAGTYTFYCQVHPNMTGTLTVH